MIKVLFVCLGNICRSPMAEYVFKDMVKKKGLEKQFSIASAATSYEEIGNDMHYGTKDKLDEKGFHIQNIKQEELKSRIMKNTTISLEWKKVIFEISKKL